MKKIILSIIIVIITLILFMAVWTGMYPEQAYVKTPSGRPRSEAFYLAMDDGIRIALEVLAAAGVRRRGKDPPP